MKLSQHLVTALLSVLLPLLILPGSAQPGMAASHPLWKMEKEGTPVYLLGSIHMMPEKSYPLPEAIEAAYKQAEIVVFEADPAEMQKPELQALVLKLGMYPAGETLKENVKPETFQLAEQKAGEFGLPMPAVNQMRPWLAGLMMVVMQIQKLGFDPEQGVDQHFLRRAREDKKEVQTLETAEHQIRLISTIADKFEDEYLRQSLSELDVMESHFKTMIDAWRKGDLKPLEELMQKSFEGHPQIRQQLLVDRNKAWIPQIKKLVESRKPALIIVGSAHMVGKESVVEMLEQEGYTVTQQ